MRADFTNTIVTGLIAGDAGGLPEVPEGLVGLPMERLRVLDGRVVDAASFSRFWIDPEGRKQVQQIDPAWPSVDCIWTDRLIAIEGGWRAESSTEKLAVLKIQLQAAIDRDAERERLRYVTPGATQQAVYVAKEDEARRASAEQSPDPADYPLLAASIGIEGETVSDVAGVVLATAAAWRQIAGAIEAARLGTKAAIAAATTEAGARAAAAAVAWPEG